jgi:hypothetical protein
MEVWGDAKGDAMSCGVCRSENQRTFPVEMNIHFPGVSNLTTPTVLAFLNSLVCLDCGFTEFILAETEVKLLANGIAENAPSSWLDSD